RVIVIVPFDATALEREEQWMGEGVAQILALGLAQQPSIVQIERARLRSATRGEAWTESSLTQATRTVRADAALFGRLERRGTEAAVDLLSRAIEVDPSFVVATYMLGVVHSALGNRWKAAAQFRASTQLDASYPEPAKALGDLYLSQPRRLFDQAVEAYSKAIELRPFYADAYVGLGDAKAAKSDVDGAIAAYQKALVYNPVNPRV